MMKTKGRLNKNPMSEYTLKVFLIPRGAISFPCWISWITLQIWHDSWSPFYFHRHENKSQIEPHGEPRTGKTLNGSHLIPSAAMQISGFLFFPHPSPVESYGIYRFFIPIKPRALLKRHVHHWLFGILSIPMLPPILVVLPCDCQGLNVPYRMGHTGHFQIHCW